ncbi:MAG: serine protease [Desulfobacterales bacterium]|jgi:hypothetical protein
MKSNSKEQICRALIGLVALTTLVMAVDILPVMAQQRTIRVGSEKAVGGLTVAEQAARSLHLHEKLITTIPPGAANAKLRIEINQKDRDDLAVTPPSGTAPLRVGVVKSVPGNIGKAVGQAFNKGVVEQNSDGSFVWAMTLTSPGAQAIRVHFTDFSLPDNTEMYFLGPNGQAHGPYFRKGRNNNGDFWTRSIVSDTGTLVLNYTGDTPDIDQPKMLFTISDVGHIRGRPPRSQEKSHDTWPCSDNAPCVVDANCVNATPADPAKDAVAKMEWIEGRYIYTCSGGLLADTDGNTQIPYFLTANHCLSSDTANLETFFNYTTDSCKGSCPDSLVTGGTPPPASTIGATVVATGSEGDFTLLTLDQKPPADAVFLGWNNAPVAFTYGEELYRISNPNFGPQVYSVHVVDTSSPQCTGWPRGERIYSVDQTGTTMGGSSGSPVLNSAGEVVGQLSGCCGYNCGDECDSENNWTVDGALANYWDAVAEFLDPQQPECTIDADCPDNGLFCNGTETCVSGSCQSSGDPCPGGTVCNEETDTCDVPVCDDDGYCEAGEDCNNCPNDCRQKTTGAPKNRYCCDGDLPDCGDARCSDDGWSCGGGDSSCADDADCPDDELFCTGDETCVGGSCQSSGDPCTGGTVCNETEDVCVDVTCGGNKAPCSVNSDCCSNTCVNGSCRGN